MDEGFPPEQNEQALLFAANAHYTMNRLAGILENAGRSHEDEGVIATAEILRDALSLAPERIAEMGEILSLEAQFGES